MPLQKRGPADAASPSNIERLEQVFEVNPLMLRGLIFPAEVKASAIPGHMSAFWKKYGIMLDTATASAYGAIGSIQERINSDEGSVVLVSKDHPAFEADKLRAACGEAPPVPDFMKAMGAPVPGAAPDSAGQRSSREDFAGFCLIWDVSNSLFVALEIKKEYTDSVRGKGDICHINWTGAKFDFYRRAGGGFVPTVFR